MKAFVCLLLVSASCSASYIGHAVSSQYQKNDGHGGYSYGYSDPNSEKHETGSHGVVHGGYSYIDGHGHVQSVKYTADPIHGFTAVGTNLPKDVNHGLGAHSYAAPWSYEIAPLGLKDGHPIDTPEVQHARAAHFAAYHKIAKEHGIHKRSIWGYSAPSWGYDAPAPVNGVPVDTPEVAHAKAEHLAAHSKALAGQHFEYSHNEGPVDTPEVAHAKAAHFAAHAALGSKHVAPYYPQYVPVTNNGVPEDTPEVKHAKAAHFAALAKAKGYSSNYVNAHHHSNHQNQYQEYVPIIHKGVPVDTPEVQHARAAHFAAIAKAKSHASIHHSTTHDHHHQSYQNHHQSHYQQHLPIIHNGVPVDTPEVQHARAVHLAALAAAKSNTWDNQQYVDRSNNWDNNNFDGQWNSYDY